MDTLKMHGIRYNPGYGQNLSENGVHWNPAYESSGSSTSSNSPYVVSSTSSNSSYVVSSTSSNSSYVQVNPSGDADNDNNQTRSSTRSDPSYESIRTISDRQTENFGGCKRKVAIALFFVCLFMACIGIILKFINNLTPENVPKSLSDCISTQSIFKGDNLDLSCTLEVSSIPGATKLIVRDLNQYVQTGDEPYFIIDGTNSSTQKFRDWIFRWDVHNDSVSVTLQKQNISCIDDKAHIDIVIVDSENKTLQNGTQSMSVTGKHKKETPNYVKIEDGLISEQTDISYETRIDGICKLSSIPVTAHVGTRGSLDMSMTCKNVDRDGGSHLCQLTMPREEFKRITKFVPNPESTMSVKMANVLPEYFTERVPCTTTKECEFNKPCVIDCGIRLTSQDRSLVIYRDNQIVGTSANLGEFEIGIADGKRIQVTGYDIVQGVLKFEMKYKYTSCTDSGVYVFGFQSNRNITISVSVTGYINTAGFFLEENEYGYIQGKDGNIGYKASLCTGKCDRESVLLNISGINVTSTSVKTSMDGSVCKVEWSQELRQVGIDLNGTVVHAMLSFYVGDTFESIVRSKTLYVIQATFCLNKQSGCNYAHPYSEHRFISCGDGGNIYARPCSDQNKFIPTQDCKGIC